MLLLYLVYLVRSTLFVFILALLFAYLLSPLVNLLDRASADQPHAHARAGAGLRDLRRACWSSSAFRSAHAS